MLYAIAASAVSKMSLVTWNVAAFWIMSVIQCSSNNNVLPLLQVVCSYIRLRWGFCAKHSKQN